MEQTDPQSLIIRGIEAVEATKGQLIAVEKSLDGVKFEVTNSASTAAAAATFLSRIACAEEERVSMQKEQDQRKEVWLEKIWSSTPIQLLMIAIVVGLMQMAGLKWVAETYIEHSPAVAGGTYESP